MKQYCTLSGRLRYAAIALLSMGVVQCITFADQSSLASDPPSLHISNKQNSSPPQLTSRQEYGLWYAIGALMAERGTSPDAAQQFLVELIDLNNDEKLDALVLLTGANWCNREACTLLVFEGRTVESFELVSRIPLIQRPFQVSQETTNGWRNLIVTVHRDDGELEHVVLQFDGMSYLLNQAKQPSLEPNVDVETTEEFIQEN